MSEWLPIDTAPENDMIIGYGFSRSEDERNRDAPDVDAPDVRIIKRWKIVGGGPGGWLALNRHSWFTVGFYPTHWMPLPPTPGST